MTYRPNIKNADGTLKDLPLEAETTVKLKTPRSIGLSGVTATAQSFDGSGNITIVISGIPPTLLSSGTASISITGNAGSATKLADSRSIGLSGVTATAQNFDGTSNITIPISAVPAALLTGTIANARLPIATTSIGAVKNGGNVKVNSDGTMTAETSGAGITVTARSGLGNLTKLDDVLNFISEVLLGKTTIEGIKAKWFDVRS